MDPMPLVSVVIPVYNGANYVGEAIRSALDQTYANIEVIVVDDGSTDGGATTAVVRGFGNAVRYIHKPNGGVATVLNLGIEVMHGTLFSWLSHDDAYKPEKVAAQVETWRRFGHPCVVVGDFEVMDENGTLLGVVTAGKHNLLSRPLDGVFHGVLNGCALLIPRTLFDRAGRFEPGLPTTQDYHLWYRMARLVPFVHSPQALVRQRAHPLQSSRQRSHLDEPDRMFIHLVDETPAALMRAYDGSELGFLLRLYRSWPHYPGAHAYVGRRARELLDRLTVAVVLLCGNGERSDKAGWTGAAASVSILTDPGPSGSAAETVVAALAATTAGSSCCSRRVTCRTMPISALPSDCLTMPETSCG